MAQTRRTLPTSGVRTWRHFTGATGAALALWALAAVHGYAWQLIWLPAAAAGSTWPSHRRRTPTVDVLTEIEIARPRHDVAAYAADPGNASAWYQNIERVEWRSDPPAGVGSRVAFVARFLGRRLAYTYEITELVPDERLVMRTADGPFPMETTYTWSDTSTGGTRMTLRNRGRPSGFSRIAAPVLATAMRRANHKDLERLKQLLQVPSR